MGNECYYTTLFVAERQTSTWHHTGWNNGGLGFSSPTDTHHMHLSSFEALTPDLCSLLSKPRVVSLAWWMSSQTAPLIGVTSLSSDAAAVPQQSLCSPLAELRENYILVCWWRKQNQWQNFFKWTKPSDESWVFLQNEMFDEVKAHSLKYS